MRCFIAIEFPKNINERLVEIQNEFRDTAKIKFVNHFHITLKFLGEIPERDTDEVRERLRRIKFKHFKLELAELGVFPNENYIRVIWVGVKGKLKELQQKIDSELLDKFSKDERFSAHITLGRVKYIKDKKNFIEKLRKIKVNDNFEISYFKLMKSVLKKDGPEHSLLEKYELN